MNGNNNYNQNNINSNVNIDNVQNPVHIAPTTEAISAYQQQNLESNSKKQKGNKGLLIIIIIVCILLIVGFILINNKKNNNVSINSKEEISSVEKIWEDYNNRILTADEYVKYLLYSDYDSDLLDQKYKSSAKVDLIEIEDFIKISRCY